MVRKRYAVAFGCRTGHSTSESKAKKTAPALTNGRRINLVVIITKGMIFQLFDKKDRKKYLCYTCGHYGICMYEKDYIKAQDKVDNGLIDVMVETPFIRPVKLECKYFVRNGIIPAPR